MNEIDVINNFERLHEITTRNDLGVHIIQYEDVFEIKNKNTSILRCDTVIEAIRFMEGYEHARSELEDTTKGE